MTAPRKTTSPAAASRSDSRLRARPPGIPGMPGMRKPPPPVAALARRWRSAAVLRVTGMRLRSPSRRSQFRQPVVDQLDLGLDGGAVRLRLGVGRDLAVEIDGLGVVVFGSG